jgi:hypothetical protein
MATYHFDLLAADQLFLDCDGTDLADDGAAVAHASRVACEMMKGNAPAKRHWRLRVSDSEHTVISDLLFASVDGTLDHFTPQLRQTIENVCREYAGVRETIAKLDMSIRETRAVMARRHGKPFLATIGDRRLATTPAQFEAPPRIAVRPRLSRRGERDGGSG